MFWDSLKHLACPVLIAKGESEGSLLSPMDMERMVELIPSSEVLTLPSSAHGLAEADKSLFAEALKVFMAKLDLSP